MGWDVGLAAVVRWWHAPGGSKFRGRGLVLLWLNAESLLRSGRYLALDNAKLRFGPTPRAPSGLALRRMMGSLVLARATGLLQVPKVLSEEYEDSLQLAHSFLKSGNGGPVSTVGGAACCALLSMMRHLVEALLGGAVDRKIR